MSGSGRACRLEWCRPRWSAWGGVRPNPSRIIRLSRICPGEKTWRRTLIRAGPAPLGWARTSWQNTGRSAILAARRIAGGVTFSLPRGLVAQSIDDVAESGSDPLVGGSVLVLERLEVIQHPVEFGHREPRWTGVTLEHLHLADQVREVLQRVPLISGEIRALAKPQGASDHSQRLHDPSQLAPVAGNVLDDAPLDLGVAGADFVDVDEAG